MIIEKLSSLTVKVSLTTDELSEYRLTFERLDSDDCDTANLISHILHNIRSHLGINLFGESLYIEAFGTRNGCIFYISAAEQKYCDEICYTDNTTELITLETSEPEKIISFSREIINILRKDCISSSLYSSNHLLRLIIEIIPEAEDYVENSALKHKLKILSGSLNAAATKEYFECIFENDSVQKLSEKSLF